MLDVEKTNKLIRMAKEGDSSAKERLLIENNNLIKSIVRRYLNKGVEYDDLFQVASLALVKGIERFDERKGVKFSTFITPTITGEIKNYFRDRSRLVHLPRKVAELRGRVKRESDSIAAETGKAPTPRELSALLGVTEEEIVRCMEAGRVVSLDRPVDGEDGATFYDLIAAEGDPFESFETRDAVKTALSGLSARERELIRYRYGEQLSQTETAKRMNVSQMCVSRVERKVLARLKEELKGGMA